VQGSQQKKRKKEKKKKELAVVPGETNRGKDRITQMLTITFSK
jgi:hypothetical protein